MSWLVMLVMLVASGQALAEDQADSDPAGEPSEPAPEPSEPAPEPSEPAPEPAPEGDADPAGSGDGDSGSADPDPGSAEPAGGDDAGSAEPAGSGAGADSPTATEDTGPGEAPPPADPNDVDGDGRPDGSTDTDGDGVSDAQELAAYADVDPNAQDSDGDGTPDALDDGDIDNDGVPDAQEEDPPTDPFDQDGDGKIEPDEIADRQEFAAFFDDIPNFPNDDALDARPDATELLPSIDAETFRTGVRLVKKIVLEKMSTKIAKKADQRMATFSKIVVGISLTGFLLLLMPFVLKKKYPGQMGMLMKYSALAAATFVVTVNLFGAVLFGLRTVQGALSKFTNPSIAIAGGTFDTLDEHADKFIVMGKELFLPTLEQVRNQPEEQPSVTLLENGVKIVEDAKVFMTVARMFKKVDFIFSALPIVLTIVTLLLFVLAIRPTLVEIIKLPATAAAGNDHAGKDVVAGAMRRVKGELLASICTVGVLAVLTMISSWVLGQIVKPALDALLTYFSLTVTYLQFAKGASSGLVFVTLFAVIFFLVLNLAALILSMSFFLGKSQKIFQQKFNEGSPVSKHTHFFKWGTAAVLLVQIFPLLFALVAAKILDAINDSVMSGASTAESISWGKLLLSGPAFLVAAFLVLFWAIRGVKAMKFLATYKVKPPVPKDAPPASAEPAT